MSRWTPCSRREFVRKLRRLGFEGPYAGARHQVMVLGTHRLAVPTNAEFSVPQLRMMIREVEAILAREIRLEDWAHL